MAKEILHANAMEPFLPQSQRTKFRALIIEFVLVYCVLANKADTEKKMLFTVAPKHHYMWHLGYRSMFLNPRVGNTMLDEDFVGRCKDVVQACAHGTSHFHKECFKHYEKLKLYFEQLY